MKTKGKKKQIENIKKKRGKKRKYKESMLRKHIDLHLMLSASNYFLLIHVTFKYILSMLYGSGI